MVYQRFKLTVWLHIIFLFCNLCCLVWALLSTGTYYATTLLLLVVLFYQVYRLESFVSNSHKVLENFFSSLKAQDYSQSFNVSNHYDDKGLSMVYSEIAERFKSQQYKLKEQLNYFQALVEHVPLPLLSVNSEQEITLHNSSARRLFGQSCGLKWSELKNFGDDLQTKMLNLEVGQQVLVAFRHEGMEQHLTLSATQLNIAGRSERLIALQNIQNELDVAQLSAWQELVHVLTHEIMNSITPVASLASTSLMMIDELVSRVKSQPETKIIDIQEDLNDIDEAVQIVAKRSENLMTFVTNYRQLTRLPEPKKERTRLADVLDHVIDLVMSAWQTDRIHLQRHYTSRELCTDIDRGMIEQVLINLLKNAEQALRHADKPIVTVSLRLNRRGRLVIEVADNGSGVDQSLVEKVFIPFFTTKQEGSGVGLALARQTMTAHGGGIAVNNNAQGGASFLLTF